MDTPKNPVVLDEDRLFDLITAIDEEEEAGAGLEAVTEFVLDMMSMSFEAGREDVLKEGAVRTAMMEQQAAYLDWADKDGVGDGVKHYARGVAAIFEALAKTYKKKSLNDTGALPLPNLSDDVKSHKG